MTAKYKVFGIGFHKTGTTSLAAALRRLGYSVARSRVSKSSDIGRAAWQACKREIGAYDAFQDNPWPIFYKKLYAYCPQAKFILTVRPAESWLRSIVDHAGSKSTPMREWIYGAGNPSGHEHVYLERYERHNRDVQEFFADKPDSLLVMDFAAGDGWEKLCGFLQEWPLPTIEFPHKRVRRPSVADEQPCA